MLNARGEMRIEALGEGDNARTSRLGFEGNTVVRNSKKVDKHWFVLGKRGEGREGKGQGSTGKLQ